MKNFFLAHTAKLFITVFLASLSTVMHAQTVDCSKLVHIYAATTTATSTPLNDASRLYTYKSTDGYVQTQLTGDMVYPNDFSVVALRGKKIQINGLALNPRDGYLYGFDVVNANRLLKIDKDGNILGVIAISEQGGLSDNKFPTNSLSNYATFTNKVGGACFAPNGTMYVATSTQSASNPTSGFSRIWKITGIHTASNTDNYSTRMLTDDLADGGFGDLLVNIFNTNELYVAAVGAYGTGGATLKGIKKYRISTGADLGFVMVSSDSFNKNYAVLGLSYNDKGDFVGVTNVMGSGGTGTKILFTMDECGNILEYTQVASGPYTGDGTSIFPF